MGPWKNWKGQDVSTSEAQRSFLMRLRVRFVHGYRCSQLTAPRAEKASLGGSLGLGSGGLLLECDGAHKLALLVADIRHGRRRDTQRDTCQERIVVGVRVLRTVSASRLQMSAIPARTACAQ